jgi:hypothetical protein
VDVEKFVFRRIKSDKSGESEDRIFLQLPPAPQLCSQKKFIPAEEENF